MQRDRKNVKLSTDAGSEYITVWHHGVTVVLTGSPLCPIPGNPGSPLRPGFPCTATVLPMSAGSTGHTSHGSPWRLSAGQLVYNMSYVDERAHRGAVQEITDNIYGYLLSFRPCWSSWSLLKQHNPSQILMYQRSLNTAYWNLMHTLLNINQCLKSVSPDLPEIHLLPQVPYLPVNTHDCVCLKNIDTVTLKTIIKKSIFCFELVSFGVLLASGSLFLNPRKIMQSFHLSETQT